MVVLVVVSTGVFFALRNSLGPIMDAEMAKQAAALAAKNPQMTPDQDAQSTSMMEKFAVFGVVICIWQSTAGLPMWAGERFAGLRIVLSSRHWLQSHSRAEELLENELS